MSNNPRHLRPPLTVIDDVLKYYAGMKRAGGKRVSVVQVGANDGITDDPIHSYIKSENWKALLVEPQPDVFETRLKRNYKNTADVFFENVALGQSPGELPFYQLSFTKDKWATGLASFVKACLQAHIENGYVREKSLQNGIDLPDREEDWIEEVKVKVDTFANILRRNDFGPIDFLCVDTEGYDHEVLKLFDFEKWMPELVLFESKNLSNDEFVQAQALLKGYGYRLFWQRGNTLALRFNLPRRIGLALRIKAFVQKI